MSTESETRRDFPHQPLRCYWPKRFTKRQPFNPDSENQTYLEYLQIEQYLDGGVSDDKEEDEDEDEDEDGISSEDNGPSNAPEDEVEEQSKGADASNQISDVRRFMKGIERDKDFLDDYDIVDEVAKFCEKGSDGPFRPREKYVAILDERNIAGTIIDKGGYCRTNLEPLTLEQLFDKLSRKRLRVKSDSTNIFDNKESDAERRIVFISDLDSFIIQVIIKTASRTQAPALRDLFHKYLTRKTSIGVTISNGFPVFTVEFHMPYYVLGRSKTVIRDTRRKSDGNPLRQSQKLDFLSRSLAVSKDSNSIDQHYWLHEAQISIVITGVNNWVWTAYGFVDTYFGSKGTVEDYDKLKGQHREQEDPLAAGQLNGGEPIWTPREYFLRVVQSRIRKVLKEWNRIVHMVREEVEGSRGLAYSSSKLTAQKLEFLEQRNSQIAALSTQLIGGLSETIQAWEGFRITEANYFLFDEVPTAEPSLEASLNAIDKEFSKLKQGLRKLEQLKKELCDRREGVSSSVASDDEDIRSTVETESALSPLRVAAAWFIANRFSEDQELLTLYQLALKRLDATRFIRNNRRLLKSYYLCLKAEAQTTPEGKLVVRFLRLRATRTQISSYIYRILKPEILDLEEKAPSTDKLEYSLNRYLQSVETNNEPMVGDPLRNSEFESSSSSDEDGVDDGDDDGDGDGEDVSVDSAAHDVTHAHLQKAAQLLTAGHPFNSYKNSLHDFVFSKFIPGPTQTHTEARESPDSQENQGQDIQKIQNVGDQQDGPTTTLVSGNDLADHISWNDSETLFSRSQIAYIKGVPKEPPPSKKTFNLTGLVSNLYQSFLRQCITMAEDIGLYERALSRGFVRLNWDCTCGCCFSQDYPISQLAVAQHFQVKLIQAGYQTRILAWSLDAPVTLHALNGEKEQHTELLQTPSPFQPHQHIISSMTITSDPQASTSGQTAQGQHSGIRQRTEIDHEQTLGKVEESRSRSIMSPSDQWLLLCFYHDNHVSKAVHMEVGEDPYDDELLQSFKKEYITARGWATYFLSWIVITDIRFVRFSLIREDKNPSFDYYVEDDLDEGTAESDLVDLALLHEEWGPPPEWSERHAWAPCPADPRPQPQGKWIMHLWDKPHSSSIWLASKRLQRLCKSKVKLLRTAFNWKGKLKLLYIDFKLFRGVSVSASVPNSRDDIGLHDVVVEIPPPPSMQVRAEQRHGNSPGRGRFFVNNTPKRLEQRLKADPTTPPYGWGLLFEEGLMVPVFFKVSISLIVLLVTIVLVVICAKLGQEKGYQVFGLGSFTLAVASIIITVIFKFLI